MNQSYSLITRKRIVRVTDNGFHSDNMPQETRDEWEARVFAVYPHALICKYNDGARCAVSSSPFQPACWNERWRVAQWSRDSGGIVHVPENLVMHLAASAAREQLKDAMCIASVHGFSFSRVEF